MDVCEKYDISLKRCPFCGTMAFMDDIRSVSWRAGLPKTKVRYRVQCLNRKCLGHHGKSYVNPEVAAAKWNMRVTESLTDHEFCELIETLKNCIK